MSVRVEERPVVSAEVERAVPGTAVETAERPGAANRMYRRRSARAVAGVAGGLADHLGVNVLWVRTAFAVLAAVGGAGVLAYGLLWAFVPQEPADTPARSTSARERQQAFGLIALGIGLALAKGAASGAGSGWIGALGVALVGAALVWREADDTRRRRWKDGARSGMAGAVLGGGGRTALLRVAAGAALVITGIAIFLFRSFNLDQMQFALLSVLAALVGVAVLTVPFWLGLVRDLGEERAARIRTEERAEIAAHLHDGVLQTLSLIQRRAAGNREVAALARRQERELRTWLYDTARPTPDSLAAALHR
ncbi:MAG TPA: PspC domain-containing protein, partial [Micromonosporaceae bacterium]|nr:PspC domain-containing protein [Micromonosporaceae bacterium]